MWKFWRAVLSGSIFFYPLPMHLLIVRGMLTPALIGLAVVSVTAGTICFIEHRDRFQAVSFSLIALAALAGLVSGQAFALYLPPVVFNVFFALLFSRTLRAGAIPLVERFMRLHRGENMPSHLVQYGRRLTWLWTIFFFTMALVAALLAVFASIEAWSLFANVLNYLLVIAVFVGQFVFAYVRYRTPRLSEIIPTALRMARRAAGHTSIGR